MLGITAVSDADYYLRGGSGCGGSGAGGSAAEYELDAVAAGEPPGQWLYPHRNHLGVSGEIHAEGPSGDAFRTVLNELCHPVTGEQLGRAPQHFASLEERMERFAQRNPHATPEQVAAERVRAAAKKAHAVHAWDHTFSVTKSVSVLHAALERDGRADEAAEVTAAVRAGIETALGYAADELGVTRRGTNGPEVAGRSTSRFVRENNLQTAIFFHHTSRDRDPQLHAHVMVLNRVLCEDGQWRALYSPALLKNKHLLDAIFQRVLEAELTARLGTRFAARPDGKAREVVGVSPEVRDLFSSRTRALTEEAQALVDAYTARYGRPPSRLAMWRMNQRATLKSRRAKPGVTPTREADLERWEAETATAFREGLAAVLEEVDLAAAQPAPDSDFDPDVVIAQALADLTERKGTWNRSHLTHAINAHLPDMLAIEPARVPALLTELTDAALEGRSVVSLSAPSPIPVPASLTDPKTGDSVFEAPTGGRYTSRIHLDREDSLVAWLDRRGAPALTEATAREVLAGRGLSEEQLAVGVAILASDRAVEIVNAAAGTGKSRLMAALSDTSTEVWGHGLTGFTTAQNAAQVLQREGVARAHNIAAFLDFRERERRGAVSDVERAQFAVPKRGTVVVDETSMVSTPHLVALRRELEDLGVARVVLIGDTAQVDAVDAGGAFRMLVDETGRAPAATSGHQPAPGRVHTLHQVRRFTHEWERGASIRVRDGDLTALTAYEARGRIRGGAPEDVEASAVDAFLVDHLSGDETVLIVSTGEKAAELSSRIRSRLAEAGHVSRSGVALHDHTTAGVGDLVQTRQNDTGRGGTGAVNREVWLVAGVDEQAGTLEVRRDERDEHGQRVWGAPLALPAAYVAHHVELAYSATVEAVEGRTTDTSHTLVDEGMGRSRLYPAWTRGRERNTAWVPITPPTRRENESDEQYAQRTPTPLQAMATALEREDHTEAARTVRAAEEARATHLGHLGPQWQILVAEHRSVEHRQVLADVVGTDRHALFADPALDGVLHLMRSAEGHGYDVRAVVAQAYGQAHLEGARSPAGLLYGLIDKALERATPAGEPERTFTYLDRTPRGDGEHVAFARETARVMDARVTELGERAAGEAPGWAVDRFGPVPVDPVARGAWAGRAGVVAGYREQYGWTRDVDAIGPAPSRAEPERRWAWLRAANVLGMDSRERDMAGLDEGDLANRVLAWRREVEWMPRNVDDDLRYANVAHTEARRQVVEARTRGEDTTVAEVQQAQVEARMERLEVVAAARARAVAHTAASRDRAQEALVELDRRVARDLAAEDREQARHAAAERDAWEAADRAADEDALVHAAVAQRWTAQHVDESAPLFGSPHWAELDVAAPARRASVFTAALQWWRMGNTRDEAALAGRLAEHDADVATYEPLSHRALERIRGGMDEDEARAMDPAGTPEVLEAVHRYAEPHLLGEAPAFGSREYAGADDEVRGKAETRAALAWWHGGDDLDAREARADVADERAAARAIAEDLAAERTARVDNRPFGEVARARGETPPEPRVPIQEEEPLEQVPEPRRPDTSWVRAVEPLPVERAEPDTVQRDEPEPTPVERDPEPVQRDESTAEVQADDLHEQVERARVAVERMDREASNAPERVAEPDVVDRSPEPVVHDVAQR
jgi:conjugative relaxase-like TrwC/TraI family protein